MLKKKIIFILFLCLAVTFLSTGCMSKKNIEEKIILELSQEAPKKNSKPVIQEKKYDLYSSSLYDLPLISILEISKLSNTLKSTIDKCLEESQGFYFLKKYDDKIFVILQNPINNLNVYSRHNLQFLEIDLEGKITYHNAGYVGINNEINNLEPDEDWIFDDTSKIAKPVKHIAYNENGKVKFIETWNYNEEEQIKYQMKNSENKLVSILKESKNNDSNLLREHIFYDNDGNITMSLTVNYDGANISRVTFYNSHDTVDSFSIISEFAEENKVKELIYDEDYELINTLTSEYNDNKRMNIKYFDKDNNLIEKISS